MGDDPGQALSSWWAKGQAKAKRSKKSLSSEEPPGGPLPVPPPLAGDNPIRILSEVYGNTTEENDQLVPPMKPRSKKKQERKQNQKFGDKNKRAREALKAKKSESRDDEIKFYQEKLGDPFDDMCGQDVKRMVVHLYFSLSKHFEDTNDLISAVESVSGHKKRFIINTVTEFRNTFEFKPSMRGKTYRLPSPINDEDFRQEFIAYVKSNSNPTGRKNMTIDSLTAWVNEELHLSEEYHYKRSTICDWLHDCGFEVTAGKKMVYFDGHEREDVVKDRKRFDKEMMEAKKKVDRCNEISLEMIPSERSTHVRVTQDEKVHHSNDVQTRFWSDGHGERPPPKSQGATVMTSDFFCEEFGHVILSPEELVVARQDPECGYLFSGSKSEYQDRKAGAILNVSTDGYYNHEACSRDFKKASWIVKFKTKKISIFITDNSPIHNYMAEDSLNATKMNKGSGGQQPKMRSTTWGDGIFQSMVFESGPLMGQAKGLKVVLGERYGEEFVAGKTRSELADIMSQEEDFLNEKSLLEKEAEARGDHLIRCVKFHPELNPVESCYRNISKYMRANNVIGTTRGHIERIEASYENSGLSVEMVRKYFRSSDQYLKLYMEGATGDNIQALMKIKRKHRGAASVLGDAPSSSSAGTYPRFRPSALQERASDGDDSSE